MPVIKLQSLLVSETFLAVLSRATQRSLFLVVCCMAPALTPVLHGHSC